MNSIAVVMILFLISCQTRHDPISIDKKSQPKQLGKSFTNKDSLFRLQIQRSENSVKIIPPIHSEFELPDSSIKTEPFKYGDFNADGTEDILTYMVLIPATPKL
jgi:hypothetical protein